VATKIEVILNGVGSITVEHDDVPWSRREVLAYADTALRKLEARQPRANRPIGFGAGERSDGERNHGQDPDPYDAGWVIR